MISVLAKPAFQKTSLVLGLARGSIAKTSATFSILPAVSTFRINNGVADTTSRTVTLNNTVTGSPTHYMASEFANFSGSIWQTYVAAPPFTLSAGEGVKTVYFKVKDANSESASAQDTITLSATSPVVSSASQTNSALSANYKRRFITANRASGLIANAGIDQLARRDGVITLDGSRSYSTEENVPLTYQWSFVSRPAGMRSELSDSKSVNPTFTLSRHGKCELQLVVKDSLGKASEPDTVIISTKDTAPVAHAGCDQTISKIGTRVALNGASSYDPDGDVLAYQWSFITRPAKSAAHLKGAGTARPSFVADVSGDYVIQLTVTDEQGHSSTDTVTVSSGNVRPVANAGKSLAVKVGDTVTLAGDGTDANGDALSYRWVLSSLPGGSQSELGDSLAGVATFTPDRAGTYVVQLVVNDGSLDSEPSSIQIEAFTVQTEAIAALRGMEKEIADMDRSAFKNGDMQNLLLNKLNAVIANVEAGKHADAANQLRNDVLPKMGGAENAEGGDAVWITDRSSQRVCLIDLFDTLAPLF